MRSHAAVLDPKTPEAIVEELVLPALKSICAESLYGLYGRVGAVVSQSEEELNRLSRCAAFPLGLDFSTKYSDVNARRYFYAQREEIQETLGLYFVGISGAGMKFTMHPLIGMQWREQEFEIHSAGNAKQLCRMWRIAFAALGEHDRVERRENVLTCVDDRARHLAASSSLILSSVVESFPAELLDREVRRRTVPSKKAERAKPVVDRSEELMAPAIVTNMSKEKRDKYLARKREGSERARRMMVDNSVRRDQADPEKYKNFLKREAKRAKKVAPVGV